MEKTELATDSPKGKCHELAIRLADLPQVEALKAVEVEVITLMANVGDSFTFWAEKMIGEPHRALGWSQVLLQAANTQARLAALAVDLRAKRADLQGTD